MGYYMRVLALSPEKVPLEDLRNALAGANLPIKVSLESDSVDWANIAIESGSEHTIAALEFDPVTAGSFGEEEIGEFLESITACSPRSAVGWLQSFLPKVKAIYTFQVLSGARALNGGWESLWALMEWLRKAASGIIQADGEGFSNLDGYHILWQFSDKAAGEFRMAVLLDGAWVTFIMDLGDRAQREAFLNGEVPVGVEIIEPDADLGV